jgi:hypothetical protein
MCLIIHKPKGLIIPPKWLDEAIIQNPDGWGVMGAKDGRLQISRGMKMKKLHKAVEMHGDVELFVHLRFATHGKKNVENCHPFVICGNRFAMMHNGILDVDTKSNENLSDSWHFANGILSPALEELDFDQKTASAVGDVVGRSNKLAVLCHDGRSMIINKDMGDEKDGFWLSNIYSIEPRKWTGLGWYDSKWTSSAHSTYEEPAWSELEDLAWLPNEELEELCRDDPNFVAEAIREYFTEKAYARRNTSLKDYR